MAKKLTKRQRDKIKDEMWQMLVMAHQGYTPQVLNEDDSDIPGEIGVTEWLKWVDALRCRYASHEQLEISFVTDNLTNFLEFPDAHERICELIDTKAKYDENDAAKRAAY
jgi:hypothetical protein